MPDIWFKILWRHSKNNPTNSKSNAKCIKHLLVLVKTALISGNAIVTLIFNQFLLLYLDKTQGRTSIGSLSASFGGTHTSQQHFQLIQNEINLFQLDQCKLFFCGIKARMQVMSRIFIAKVASVAIIEVTILIIWISFRVINAKMKAFLAQWVTSETLLNKCT